MNQFLKMIKDCLTENDGASYCPFRVAGSALAGTGIPTFIGCTIYTTVASGHFDFVQFGVAFGGMMTGLSALTLAVSVKAKTDTAGPA